MAPAEWDQIFDLFHAAREKSGGERVLLLDTACGENTLLRKAVEELLREDESASGFLSRPLFGASIRESRQMRIVAGQRFGRYVTLALIGRGGMGEVWSAFDSDLDRTVALKFLSSDALACLDANQITREAKAASALNHPGIVTIHEVVQAESTLAIVMELVEGTPLRELCGKAIPTAEVLAVGHQIAQALAAAHACGTIHGDIKPENIFVRRDRFIKLLDFGLARKITTEAIALSNLPALGTLRYMSPEQARGESLTPASDVFSLGLVLYELTTGRHPFHRASALETARAILHEDPLPAKSVNHAIPSRLDSLIQDTLAKDAAQRPSAQDVARALTELQENRHARPSRASTFWKWGIVILLIAVASLFAIEHWKRTRETPEAPIFRQITTLVPENRATAAAISPDGKRAAYANIDGIFLRDMNDGGTRPLAGPSDFTVDRIAWFSNSKDLLVGGFSNLTHVPSIWIVSPTGETPRLLRAEARDATPSPDGTQVVFLTPDLSEIWTIGVSGEERRRIATCARGDRFELVFWTADGQGLGFQRHRFSTPVQARSYESLLLTAPEVVTKGPDLHMSSAESLRNGHLLFLQWDTDDTSSHQVWETRTDLHTGRVLEKPRRVAAIPGEDVSLLCLSVTADGKQVMVLKRSDQNTIFVGDFDSSSPRISNTRRLTLDERTNYPHAWTADSRSVIFESNRNGNFDLFRQRVDHRTPEVIVETPLTEILPQLSPDGRFVLYAARGHEDEQPWYYKPGTYKLMRVPIQGGEPEEVPIGGMLDEFRCALTPGKRCVLRISRAGGIRTYYDLDPIGGKGRELATTKWPIEILGDWDISPDGSEIAIPNHSSQEGRIRIVSLEPKANGPRERDLVLKGLRDLNGLVWAADGHGWFVSVITTVGRRLLYVYEDGRFIQLGDIQGWAVPSPDGQRVAFLDGILATNAWLIERR